MAGNRPCECWSNNNINCLTFHLCLEVSCVDPPVITHATHTQTPPFLYEDTVTYTCNHGYTEAALDSNPVKSSVFCQADRTWTTTNLLCTSR